MSLTFHTKFGLGCHFTKNRPTIPASVNESMSATNHPALYVKSAIGTTALNLLNGSAHSTPRVHTSAITQPGDESATEAPMTATTGDQTENQGAGAPGWAVPRSEAIIGLGVPRTETLRSA